MFAVNLKAYELSAAEAKNKLRTLTQGKNSENVLGLMATFKALVDYAEWTPEEQIFQTPSETQRPRFER